MSYEEQHGGSRWHRRTGARAAAVLVPLCLLAVTSPLFATWGSSPPAGATSSPGAVSVVVAAYAGDAVTSTPSGSVLAGSDVTYQVEVTDNSADVQSGVSVPVTLPGSFVLHPSSVAASAGTASTSSNVLSWSVGSLAAGASATLTYTETADAPSMLESDSTTASVTSEQATTPSTASTSVGVVPTADLTIAVSDGAGSVSAGASDTYTVTLTDNGPSAVTNATVTDTFTPDVGALGGASSLSDANFTDLGGGQGDWTGVDLASGASATFEVGVSLPLTLSAGSTVVDLSTVTLAPGQIDTATTYNAIDTDVVTGVADSGPLALSVTSSDGHAPTGTTSESALAGSPVTYQVTVTNRSSSAQTGMSVPVSLPSGFTLSSGITASDGSADAAGDVVNWSIPSLAPGASATVQYTETTDDPGSAEVDTTSASAVSTQSPTVVTASDAVVVIPAADLSVGVDDGVTTVAAGSSVTYTVTVTNDGPSPATDASVTEAFDGGFNPMVDVSSIGGTEFSDLGTDAFAWSGVDLGSGASATFTLTGDVASDVSAGGEFVDVASAGLPPGQVDTAASSSALDADPVVAVPQAISFTAPATGLAGQSVTLSAAGGASGNPVVFSVDPSSGTGVCSVAGTNGATLTFTAAGTCVVDADQAGSTGYAAAPTVTATITVSQVPVFTADTPPMSGTAGQAYSYTFASGGSPTPTFALAAGAPSWLTVDASTGAVSGTPPAGSTSFSYSVLASNAVGSATAGPFTVTLAQPADPSSGGVTAALSCPSTLVAGATGACTLAVQNMGPDPARSVAAAVVLPSRLRLVRAPGSFSWFGNGGVWWLGTLGPGTSLTLSVAFRAVAPGSATVDAGVFSAVPGSSSAETFMSAQVVVTGTAAGRGASGPPVASTSAWRHRLP